LSELIHSPVKLGHFRRRQPGIDHLLNAACPLGIRERLALVVFDDLLGDALGHLGLLVSAAGGTDVDRDRVQPGLARGHCTALTRLL
jgi:hypothetical protein